MINEKENVATNIKALNPMVDDTNKEKPEPLLQFFEYNHLPEHLRNVSKPFGDMAKDIVAKLPRNPERTIALRKLLEAKDCAVRSVLMK